MEDEHFEVSEMELYAVYAACDGANHEQASRCHLGARLLDTP